MFSGNEVCSCSPMGGCISSDSGESELSSVADVCVSSVELFSVEGVLNELDVFGRACTELCGVSSNKSKARRELSLERFIKISV